jgi:O-antigen ligase
VSHQLRLSLVPAYFLLCLLLGGASAAGIWANLLLQLVGLALLLWSLLIQRQSPITTPSRQLIALLLLLLTVVAIQLIPLPPSLWTRLGGRDLIADGFGMLDQPLPWLPISLAPHRTLASLLWLMPAFAVLIGIAKLGAFRATWLAWVLIGVAIVSTGLGALQVADDSWYFYEITNYGVSTGFFSNANHQATMLVSTIPFLAALFLTARGKRSTQRSSGLLVILAGILMVLLVGLALNGSLAGFGLAIPVVTASLAMIWAAKKPLPAWAVAGALAVTAASLYIPFSTPLGNNLTTAEAKTSQFSRYTSFGLTIRAAGQHLPLGSGIGTFVEIYRTYEDPAAVEQTYINHAHSDYLELWLETGLLGATALLIFLLWWGRRFVIAWRSDTPDHFARAASIASAAILAHSMVDYPLRTAAIGALFAMCLALLAEPRPRARPGEVPSGERRARHLSA